MRYGTEDMNMACDNGEGIISDATFLYTLIIKSSNWVLGSCLKLRK